ncbi:MAG: glutamate--cysteine ligase [gamma proteobacterium symbiont of Lucinoma myriamae]|nr:glutamate--cysteine ligase [gamma proteobacterium symbiont of Lucinoma myriamae]MCU7819041.1 glutamate--cysteine ligase [gamma proteobacterium symbiont of Lucinoma myriamae]MCU7831341.1 glutamate--cysteine ligase [gamma proteobacterium symbiont of Lucinoma myriamae]
MHKYHILKKRLKALLDLPDSQLLTGNQIGLEKESLRVNRSGSIAQTAHPEALGSALTHPYITTDYSEALTEFITPPFSQISEALGFLQNTQKFVYKNLQDEILWATSMPCVVTGESSIPLAHYGTSNAGTMKNVYRRGLGHRYGRAMQLIAGVHFNFSLSESFWPVLQDLEDDRQEPQDFINTRYFDLIRNSQRMGWLVPYLFGASPAVCKSFLLGGSTTLDEFDESTYYEPYATSLRMGDIGYQNNKENESGIKACYKNIDSYISSLDWAINTPYEGYEKFGLLKDGKYQQLNTNILQIENEYYSTIRPKQILQGNEKPTIALAKRGVQYVELRSLDVNAFDPLGVNESQLHFLEAFLLFCLLHDSPVIELPERQEIDHNEMLTAHKGRMPGLKLIRNGQNQTLKDWAMEIMQEMAGVCLLLDADNPEKPYTASLNKQTERILDPDMTPSARMLDDMHQDGESFHRFAERMSRQHSHYYKNLHLSAQQEQFHLQAVKASREKQRELEAADNISFEQYLADYFTQR